MNSRASRVAVVAGWAVLAGAGMFGGVSAALASDGSIRLRVEPLLDAAIYSAPGKTQTVGWKVTVTNVGANLAGPALLLGRTVVRDPKEKAKFDNYYFSGKDPRCRSTNLFPTAVGCVIPRLQANESLTFAVSFKTPIKFVGGSGVGDVEGTDYVNFRATTIAAEDRDAFVNRDLRNRVTLFSANSLNVANVCPPGGCTAFTGTNGGIPTATDVHSTEVVVPSGDRFTTVRIVETKTGSLAVPCTDNVFECWTSQVTIPGNSNPAPVPDLFLTTSSTAATFDPYLTVFLRQDISNIQFSCGEGGGVGIASFSVSSTCYSRVPIESISVVYVRDGETAENPVGLCEFSEGFPLVRGDGLPCIVDRMEVTEPSHYYQWKLINDRNGGWGTR